MARCPDQYGTKCLATSKVYFSCGEKSHFTRSKLAKKKKKSSANGRIKEVQVSFRDSEELVDHIISVGMYANGKERALSTTTPPLPATTRTPSQP